MTIRWGIIGVGTQADRIMAPAISKANNTKLVAVCDIEMGKVKSFAAKHNVEHVYGALEDILKHPELDVLYIATPNSLHAEQTIKAAEAGIHVLCEKPMALTVDDCERMTQTCAKHKVKLGVNFQNRYHPAHIEARRYVRSGLVGEINLARCQYCLGRFRGFWRGWRNDPSAAGAGALMGLGVHSIDLLRFLLDSEVEKVLALTDENPPHYPVDNMDYFILKFRSGVHCMVVSGILIPRSNNDVVLYGSKARLTCKGTIGMSLEGELMVDGDFISSHARFPTDNPELALYINLIEAFNRSLEEDTEPNPSGYDGLEVAKVTHAILKSNQLSKIIKVVK